MNVVFIDLTGKLISSSRTLSPTTCSSKRSQVSPKPFCWSASMCLVHLCFCKPGRKAGGCPQKPTANSSAVTASGAATAGGHKDRIRLKIQCIILAIGRRFCQGFWVPLSIFVFFFLDPFPFLCSLCRVRVWKRRWTTSFANYKFVTAK